MRGNGHDSGLTNKSSWGGLDWSVPRRFQSKFPQGESIYILGDLPRQMDRAIMAASRCLAITGEPNG